MSYDGITQTITSLTSLGGIFGHYLGKEFWTRGPNGPFHALKLMAEGSPEGVSRFFRDLSTYPRGSEAWREAVSQFTRFMGNGTATPGQAMALLSEAEGLLANTTNMNPSATFPHAPRTMMDILHSVRPNLINRFGHMEGISKSLGRVEGLLSKANESFGACARYRSNGLYRAFVQLRDGILSTAAQNGRPIVTGGAAAGASAIGVAIQIGNMGVSALASAGAAGVAIVAGAALAAGSVGVGIGCGINTAIGEPCLGDWRLDPTLSEKRLGIMESVKAEKERYRTCEPFRKGTLCQN